MSDPEHFLTRWSRLKRRGGESAGREQPQGDDAAPPAAQESASAPSESGEAAPSGAQATDALPAFDPASLPPIESITAATDIRGFLAPGVPAALTRAALRRAWSADPNVRDFIEIAENQWDFTNPDSIPGFASFQPGEDIRRFVAQLVKEEEVPENPPVSGPKTDLASAPLPEAVQNNDIADQDGDRHIATSEHVAPPEQAAEEPAVVRRSEDHAASPQETVETRHATLPTRRSQGRALPQ